MRVLINFVEGLIFLVLLAPAAVLAQSSCGSKSFADQRQDEATIRRLEAAWNNAIAQGDSSFEGCLLASDFTVVVSSGEVKTRNDELLSTARNKGRQQRIPALPPMTIVIHGNVAVARGLWIASDTEGPARQIADCFVWENGSWAAVYSQLTSLGDSTHGRFLRGRLPM
jgi:hypothetical protein